MNSFEVYRGFDPNPITAFFKERGWPVLWIPKNNVRLVPVDPGAALECIDGRFDHLQERTLRGPRTLGGVNMIMATMTGGDTEGLARATESIARLGFTPGTHTADDGGCGYFDLWSAGKLESAINEYEPPTEELENQHCSLGFWLRQRLNSLGGKHFRLNGVHKEEGVRLNPYQGTTESDNSGNRFRIDDWFGAALHIPNRRRWLKIAEVVEQLKPDAKKLEIIV